MSRLSPRDIRRREGLPATAPARTLLDLAAHLATDHLIRLYNDARVARLIREPDLAELLDRSTGLPGAPALRLLLAQGSPGPTRSVAEDRFLSLIRRGGLPLPKANQRVAGLEVDFFWPDQRLIVEIDGYTTHSGPVAFERDRRRDARLVAAGFTVLRFTWAQLTEEWPTTSTLLAAALAA
jgi:very-short-patch-repair endonuclease